MVADAVRLLAEKTSRATSEISQMSARIQHDTAPAFRYLQGAYIQVASGVKAANQAQTTLQRIHDTADQVVQTIDGIAEAAHPVSTANAEAISLTGRIGSTDDRLADPSSPSRADPSDESQGRDRPPPTVAPMGGKRVIQYDDARHEEP